MRKILMFVLAELTVTVPVVAHPGHGSSEFSGSLMHFLLEPEHMSVAVGVLALAVYAGVRAVRSRRRGDA